MATRQSLFASLASLAADVQLEKAAALKKLAEPNDPGFIGGESSHPTAKADTSTQTATEGEQTAANTSAIKEQIGPTSVDSASEQSQDGRQTEVQVDIGTNKTPVSKDPSTERDYKGDKKDPGTDHPATVADGVKYGSLSFKEARAKSAELANALLADWANGFGTPAAPAVPQTKTAAEVTAEEVQDSLVAGYKLAEAMGLSKEAAAASIQDVLSMAINDANEAADLFIGYYGQLKSAADVPPGLADALGGGGGGADAAPEAGGAPPEAGGGAPPEAGGDPSIEQQPASEDEALQELAMALQELGIPPEALAQALAGGGAGAGGPGEAGGAGGAGGAPAPAEAEGMKLAQAVRKFQLSGKFQIKEARTKRSRQLRDIMKNHVIELLR